MSGVNPFTNGPEHGLDLNETFGSEDGLDFNSPVLQVSMGTIHLSSRLESMMVLLFDPETQCKDKGRVLLDTGSSHSFISMEKAAEYHLPVLERRVIGLKPFGRPVDTRMRDIVSLRIISRADWLAPWVGREITLITVPSICEYIVSYGLEPEQRQIIKEKQIYLGDTEAVEDGVLPVAVLIGQDYYHQMMDGPKLHLPGGLVLIPSIGGYVMGGSVKQSLDPSRQPVASPVSICVINQMSTFAEMSLEEEQQTMDQFVGVDNIGVKPIEKESSPILEQFNKTIYHDGERYVVELPRKLELMDQLKPNFPQVISRLESGMRKLNRSGQGKLKETYFKIMQEQIELGVIEEVECLGSYADVRAKLRANPRYYDTIAAEAGTYVCYLGHFPVQKARDGSYRLVYDAKAKPRKGELSLNNCLEKGPTMINLLASILIKFRLKAYGCVGDIMKAFLMIVVNPKDRDCLRLLWEKDGQVCMYRFARLPFGLTCSPFILAATLKYHLERSGLSPALVTTILEAFYVDDLVFSMDSFEDLEKWRTLTLRLLSEIGMLLRKWNSNHPKLREVLLATEESLPDIEAVLGLIWDVTADTININGERIERKAKAATTKRGVYSTAAQVFDPLGLLSPFVFLCKLLVREIWGASLNWDDPLPDALAKKWERWRSELPLLKTVTLPRHVSFIGTTKQRVVGFCDASGQGLGAAVYLVSLNGTEAVSHLITSRTRIAPTKVTEMPRLELCGAVLLANIVAAVLGDIPTVQADDVYLYTDSADVLYWIWSDSLSQKNDATNFIANRLNKIKQLFSSKQWRHIGTKSNPADKACRGEYLSKLKDMKPWFEGPEFIREKEIKEQSNVDQKKMPPGVRKEYEYATALMASVVPVSSGLGALVSLDSTNDYRELIRITDLVIRAARIWLEKTREKKRLLTLDSEAAKSEGTKSSVPKAKRKLKWRHLDIKSICRMPEFGLPDDDEAEIRWIQEIQQEHCHDLLYLCRGAPEMAGSKAKSQRKNLKVFFDPELKVLRVKTRLPSSDLDEEAVSPIYLPPESKFTSMLIESIHQRLLHAGVRNTLSSVRAEFWFPNGRRRVAKVVHRCVTCRKACGDTYALPPHGDLPSIRVRQARPWLHIGLDFAGPFAVTEAGVDIKAYMLIITDAASRAVWIGDTHGLSAYDFLLALKRFVGRHGVPEVIVSDNAKTFEGAYKRLLAIYKNKEVQRYLREHRIRWKIDWQKYCDRAPWQGGFIEKMVGEFKNIAKRVIGSAKLTTMEFATICVEVEGILNSRPLTYDYSSPDEGEPLTPSKIIYGYNLTELPPMRAGQHHTVPEIPRTTTLQRYWFMESIKTAMWNRWKREYLTSLTERHLRQAKGKGVQAVPSVGEVVLLRRENTPRRKWPLAKVVKARKSPRDGKVRTCVLLTHNAEGKLSTIERSPSFLVPLEEKVMEED